MLVPLVGRSVSLRDVNQLWGKLVMFRTVLGRTHLPPNRINSSPYWNVSQDGMGPGHSLVQNKPSAWMYM
jgi:hypothetical protein